MLGLGASSTFDVGQTKPSSASTMREHGMQIIGEAGAQIAVIFCLLIHLDKVGHRGAAQEGKKAKKAIVPANVEKGPSLTKAIVG